jgi:hypothetical protein
VEDKKMRYKQGPRIVREILSGREEFPIRTTLQMLRLLAQDRWPKFGPFKKRSAAQDLWRLASDTHRGGPERLAALRTLLNKQRAADVKVDSPKSDLEAS